MYYTMLAALLLQVAIVAAQGGTQTVASDPIPTGNSCFNQCFASEAAQILNQYGLFGCTAGNSTCYCSHPEFGDGIRNCATENCDPGVATSAIADGASYCASALGATSSASTTSAAASSVTSTTMSSATGGGNSFDIQTNTSTPRPASKNNATRDIAIGCGIGGSVLVLILAGIALWFTSRYRRIKAENALLRRNDELKPELGGDSRAEVETMERPGELSPDLKGNFLTSSAVIEVNRTPVEADGQS